MIKIVKRILIIINTFLLLTLGVVYAAQANNLGVLGVAYITGYDFESDTLPVYPVPWPDNGSYFRSTNLPPTLTQGTEEWIGNTFYLQIIKPPSLPNQGMNNFSMTFQINNPTTYPWTNGQASAAAVSGTFNALGATLSTPTLSPGDTVTVTLTFQTKIELSSKDEVRILISYVVAGKPRYFYINIIMEPGT
jgi:hypothetical protein